MLLLIILSETLTLPGMSIVLSAAVAIVGLVVYFASTNAKLTEVGRICFAFGLLAFLLLVR